MGDALVAIGGALLAASLLARGGRRIGLPTIPLFMLAGVLFGPNTPGIELVDDAHDLELLAVFGLVLLLFHLGLEFSLGDLLSGGRKLLIAGAVNLVLKVGGGLAFGALLGWGGREALVLAGAVGISSSAIATKLLVELKRLTRPESRVILGLIVVEDIFVALYLAVLDPVLGDADGALDVVAKLAVALGFLGALTLLARFGGRLVARLLPTLDDELLTISFVGIAVLLAGIAEELGVSEAIGAFMAGLVLAETSARARIEQLVLPLRDTFAALFFFAFGLTVDPSDAGDVAGVVAIAVVVTLVLNVIAGTMTARLYELGPRPAAAIGLTVVGRGELSLVLATLAVGAGLDPRIAPFVALYVLILAIVGPVLAARSDALARFVPRRLLRV